MRRYRRTIAITAIGVIAVGVFLMAFGASKTYCYPCGGFYGSGSAVCEANPNAIAGCSPPQNFVLPFQPPGVTCTIACVLQWNYTLNIAGLFVFALGLSLYYLTRRLSTTGGVTGLPAKTPTTNLQPQVWVIVPGGGAMNPNAWHNVSFFGIAKQKSSLELVQELVLKHATILEDYPEQPYTDFLCRDRDVNHAVG